MQASDAPLTAQEQERILADFDHCLEEIWGKPFKQEIKREMSALTPSKTTMTLFRGSKGGGKTHSLNVEQFTQHYLNCHVCSEVMKTVNIGDNQTPEQEDAVRRKALCRRGRRLYDRTK